MPGFDGAGLYDSFAANFGSVRHFVSFYFIFFFFFMSCFPVEKQHAMLL